MTAPDGLPALGRGRHRRPRRGACFMEYASVLAGEPWSDSPRVTHPVLAELAREVNDASSDHARPHLAVLIPQVITGYRRDSLLAQRLARRLLLRALDVATGPRRRTLSVGLLAAERACGPGAPAPDDVDRQAVRALLRDPDPDLRWALQFTRPHARHAAYDERPALAAVELSVRTMVEQGGNRTDELLRDLLVDCLALTRENTRAPAHTP